MSGETARQVGDKLGLDWTKVKIEEFRRGLEVELEHGARDPQTNVTSDDKVLTGKIAWAHLKEFPDYYTRLDRLETEADEYWASRRGQTDPALKKATASSEIRFSGDELAHLHLLLSQELESSRLELHHTAGLPYREYIKRRMEQEEALLKKLDAAVPIAQAGAAGRA
jgi:hypothetical protein